MSRDRRSSDVILINSYVSVGLLEQVGDVGAGNDLGREKLDRALVEGHVIRLVEVADRHGLEDRAALEVRDAADVAGPHQDLGLHGPKVLADRLGDNADEPVPLPVQDLVTWLLERAGQARADPVLLESLEIVGRGRDQALWLTDQPQERAVLATLAPAHHLPLRASPAWQSSMNN